jgi:hypothetical protein
MPIVKIVPMPGPQGPQGPAGDGEGGSADIADFVFESFPADEDSSADGKSSITIANKDLYIQTTRDDEQDADIELVSADDLRLTANDLVSLRAGSGVVVRTAWDTEAGESDYRWEFTDNGKIQLPGNGYIENQLDSSGDGNGYSTIKIVPDDTLETDQYLIIDPTVPNHIHIRAGGEQDASNADLILGAEDTHVMVSDNNGTVSISSLNSVELEILNEATEPSLGVITYNLGTLPSIGDTVNVEGTEYIVTEIDYTTEVEGQQIIYCDDLIFAPQTTYLFVGQSSGSSWSFNPNGVLSGPVEGLVKTYGLYGTNDGPLALIGPQGVLLDGDSGEFLNDASNPNNQIATIGDLGVDIEFEVAGGTLGTQPTFDGDPLFTGSYVKTGPMVHFRIDVDMDNITSFGAGQYYIDLPFPAKYNYLFRNACLHDVSLPRQYGLSAHVEAGESRMMLFYTSTSGQDLPFAQQAPALLTVNDNFHVSGDYIVDTEG